MTSSPRCIRSLRSPCEVPGLESGPGAGRQLHVNINLVSSEAGARAAALKSGRVDAVLWVEVMPDGEAQFDKPEGVVVTMPYYGWNKVFMIGMKKK